MLMTTLCGLLKMMFLSLFIESCSSQDATFQLYMYACHSLVEKLAWN